MNLGLYFDGDKIFVTESKSKNDKVSVLKSYYINNDEKELNINKIGVKLKGEIDRRSFNNLDITLPSDKFIINYIHTDEFNNEKEIDEYIEGKIPCDNYISKRLYTRGLEKELMINVQLCKDKINKFFRLATNLGLKPRTLTPYFTKLSSNILSDVIDEQKNSEVSCVSIAYFDEYGVDLIFLYKRSLSFFKRINYEQNTNAFIDTIKYYISSCKFEGDFIMYYYGLENQEYIDAVKRMNMEIDIKPLIMPSSINSAGSYNSMISAL